MPIIIYASKRMLLQEEAGKELIKLNNKQGTPNFTSAFHNAETTFPMGTKVAIQLKRNKLTGVNSSSMQMVFILS
ncbi:hypothetical protein M0802_005271 [Mischocyttarus mexicanus]|nr:hypothetical protein M0802_005271 [Mischocyttarus mexicanus]